MSRNIPRSVDNEEEIDIIPGWTLKGWSRAGCQTGFILYPFNILLDAGLVSSKKFDHIFITHQHTDHVHNLTLVCSRHKKGVNTVYVPKESETIIKKMFRMTAELTSNDALIMSDEEILEHENVVIQGVNPCDTIEIKDKQLLVEVLKAYHSVQSNGYGFNIWKKVVKDEYDALLKSKDINKIKQLKSEGVEMYDWKWMPVFAFYCDSTIENLTLHEEWKKYQCIVVECTGLIEYGNRDFDNNHTSLTLLKPIMLEHLNKKWILIHVSMKASQEEIKEVEDNLKAEGLNVHICKGNM